MTSVSAKATDASPVPTAPARAAYRPAYAWYVVGILTAAYVSSFIDRQIMSLMVTPIKRDLGISDSRLSLLMGPSFALFYTLLGFPIGRLADARSRRGIIGVGIAAWSVMTALCGLARNYTQLFLARVGVGVGEAALSPPAYSLLADYFPKDRLGRALGVYSLGIYLGSGIALVLGGWIVGGVSGSDLLVLPLVGGIHPWQAVFLVIGIPGVFLAILMRTVREPIRGAMGGRTVTEVLPAREVFDYVARHWRAFLAHCSGYGLIALVNYGMAAWVPAFIMRHYGWTVTRTGAIYGVLTMIFGVAGVIAGGHVGDLLLKRGHLDAKLRVGIIAAVGELISALTFLLVPDSTLMVVALVPFCFFAAFGFGAAPAGIQEISPVPMRAQTSALYLFIVNVLGLGLGPPAVAKLTDSVFHDESLVGYSLVVVAVGGLVSALAVFFWGAGAFRTAAARVGDWNLRRSS